MMETTWKSDGRTVLCCNASPKYCAPSSPIWLLSRLSVASVCMKETGMRWWRKHEKVMVALYCVAILHPNIVHLRLRFDSSEGWV